MSNPNTAAYPGSLATDVTLGVVKDRASTSLAGALNISATTFSVAASAIFETDSFITIDDEQMQIQSQATTSLTVVARGANGTVAAVHANGAAVRGNVVAYYTNQAAVEIKAIETLLTASPTGVMVGNATSPMTPTAASSVLTYFRRSPNVSSVTYGFAALPQLNSADYTFSQMPGGTISAGATTITLTPVPLGVNGTDVYHYVYLSGGTGTAEAVLITGGTAVSGASSGTIIFTAANSHSGAFTVTSASAGIVEAMNMLGTAGGAVQLPASNLTIYQTVIVGKGTATVKSTVDGIRLLGQSAGRGNDVAVPTAGGTTLTWAGPSSGTVMKVFGPIGNVTLADFQIDCAAIADIGLDIVHSFLSTYARVGITRWNAIGIRALAVDHVFAAMVTGCNNNLFDQVVVTDGQSAGSNIAAQFGQAGPNTNTIFDFASNCFVASSFVGGAGIGLNMRFADANVFTNCQAQGVIASIKFTDVTNGFPSSNNFYGVAVSGPIIPSAATFIATTPNNFYGLIEETTQTLGSLVNFAVGVTAGGVFFGRAKSVPLHYASVTTPAAIANTGAETAFARSFTIPAYVMSEVGATLRIKAAGRYTTTGTPALTLKVKLGTLVIGNFIMAAMPNNVAASTWNIDCDCSVDIAGSSGDLQIGNSWSLSGGLSPVTNTEFGSHAIDLTTAKIVTITVTWGAADPSNSAFLDVFTADILYAGLTQ